MYNEIVKKFLIFHGINPEFIAQKVDTGLYTKEDFLGLLSPYTIYKPERIEEVSIADIYGSEFGIKYSGVSVFELLNNYFKEDKKNKVNKVNKANLFKKNEDYINRSNDNLFLSSTRMIEKNNKSNDLITISRIDNANNVNLIHSNGMHRFLLLRSLYLNMISESPDKIDSIKKDFKLKVYLYEIDEIKTFCFFIIDYYYRQKRKVVRVNEEIKNLKFTGRLIVDIGENGKFNEHYIFDDDELIEFVRPMILQDLDFYKNIDIDSFKNFMISFGYSDNHEYKKIKEKK